MDGDSHHHHKSNQSQKEWKHYEKNPKIFTLSNPENWCECFIIFEQKICYWWMTGKYTSSACC